MTGSNAQLRKDFVHCDSRFALRGGAEAFFHGRAPQQVRGFTLGLDFAPEFDGHDDSGRLAAFGGDDPYFLVRRRLSLLSARVLGWR